MINDAFLRRLPHTAHTNDEESPNGGPLTHGDILSNMRRFIPDSSDHWCVSSFHFTSKNQHGVWLSYDVLDPVYVLSKQRWQYGNINQAACYSPNIPATFSPTWEKISVIFCRIWLIQIGMNFKNAVS